MMVSNDDINPRQLFDRLDLLQDELSHIKEQLWKQSNGKGLVGKVQQLEWLTQHEESLREIVRNYEREQFREPYEAIRDDIQENTGVGREHKNATVEQGIIYKYITIALVIWTVFQQLGCPFFPNFFLCQ